MNQIDAARFWGGSWGPKATVSAHSGWNRPMPGKSGSALCDWLCSIQLAQPFALAYSETLVHYLYVGCPLRDTLYTNSSAQSEKDIQVCG